MADKVIGVSLKNSKIAKEMSDASLLELAKNLNCELRDVRLISSDNTSFGDNVYYQYIYDNRTTLGKKIILEDIPYYKFKINNKLLLDLGNNYAYNVKDESIIFDNQTNNKTEELKKDATNDISEIKQEIINQIKEEIKEDFKKEILAEEVNPIMSSSKFANLYFDTLNSLNKYSWMTVPPRILWKSLTDYTETFNKINKIFEDEKVEGDLGYIGNSYDKLKPENKLKVIDLLKGLKHFKFQKVEESVESKNEENQE